MESLSPDRGGEAELPEPVTPIRRVVVCGSEAAGKSTWSAKLAECLDLPLISLDTELGNRHDLSLTEQVRRVEAMASRDRWIIEGTRVRTLPARIVRADRVYLFLYSRRRALWWSLKKFVRRKGEAISSHLRRRRSLVSEVGIPGPPLGRLWGKLQRVWVAPRVRYPLLLEIVDQFEARDRTVVFRTPGEAYAHLDALRRAVERPADAPTTRATGDEKSWGYISG